ncbi:mevalonate kinase-like [Mya arenaria]|uniref:mevalonate kinase-like n=1 Tax=Mya arenaria TaxID=6604 RepID=UPI0022E44904|nr:mevalonate kinase-like [Mya arenaria]
MNIKVSAPGKIILHGEHAVVYGKAAIAASLNLRTTVEVSENEDAKILIDFRALGLNQEWSLGEILEIVQINKVDVMAAGPIDEVLLGKLVVLSGLGEDRSNPKLQAILIFLYLYTAICRKPGKCLKTRDSSLPCLRVTVNTQLPIAAGLGSSASYSVALVAALLLQQGDISAAESSSGHALSEEHLNLVSSWAFLGEKIVHGTPSGIDNSVATFGSAIKFCAGNVTKLSSMPKLRILVTSTGVQRITKTLVDRVRKRKQKMPEVLDPIMDAVEGVTDRCLECYNAMTTVAGQQFSHHIDTLEELVDINQHLLQAMGVSHPKLDKICEITSRYDLHSKLTGAGGGGCAFTLLRPETNQEVVDIVRSELQQEGFVCFEADIGSTGVMVH